MKGNARYPKIEGLYWDKKDDGGWVLTRVSDNLRVLKYNPDLDTLEFLEPVQPNEKALAEELTDGLLEYNGQSLSFTPSPDHRRSIDMTDGQVLSDTTVSNTTDETELYTLNISPDELYEGLCVVGHVCGHYDTSSSSVKFTAKVYMGDYLLDTLQSTQSNVTDGAWDISFNLTVRSSGSSGAVISSARGKFEDSSATTADKTETTLDTTVAENFKVTITWNEADPGNSLTLTQGLVHFIG